MFFSKEKTKDAFNRSPRYALSTQYYTCRPPPKPGSHPHPLLLELVPGTKSLGAVSCPLTDYSSFHPTSYLGTAGVAAGVESIG